MKPIAWARRWHVDGEKPAKVRNESNRLVWPLKFKFLPVSAGQCLPDDVPLYAAAGTPYLPAVAPLAMLDIIAGTRWDRLPPSKREAELRAYEELLKAAPVL